MEDNKKEMNNRTFVIKNVVQLATTISKNNTLVFPLKVTFSPEFGRIVIEEDSPKNCPETVNFVEGEIYKSPSTIELIEGNIYKNSPFKF